MQKAFDTHVIKNCKNVVKYKMQKFKLMQLVFKLVALNSSSLKKI